MEIRHLKLTKFKLMLTTLLLSIIICSGEEIRLTPKVQIISSPPHYIKVLSGSTVGFTWKFRVPQEKSIKKISWYFVISKDNRKDDHKLIQKILGTNSSKESENPSLKRNRVNCTFHLNNEIWTMSCRLANVNAYDSALYGLKVEFSDGTFVSNASSLKVVDLILNNKNSDHVVQSWIDHPTVLKCAIHKKKSLNTYYEWSVVSEAKDITQGITRGANKTSYTFIPLSERDFGRYKCTIRMGATTIEHEILLQQIDYAGAPEGLRIERTDGGRFVRLFWNQPRNNGGTKIINYQIIVEGEGSEIRKDTTKLSAGVKLTDDSRYVIRVCSRNKIGIRKPDSCTTPREIKIASLPQKGNQNKLKGHLLHILAAIVSFIVLIF